MIAIKRWIALAPLALVLVIGMQGCKTGAKRYSCTQTSCTTSKCATPSCGETTSLTGLCGKKSACGSNAGCQTSKACGKTSCASSGCLTTSSKSCFTKRPVSCASTGGCKTGCTTNRSGCATVINPRHEIHQQPVIQPTHPIQPAHPTPVVEQHAPIHPIPSPQPAYEEVRPSKVNPFEEKPEPKKPLEAKPMPKTKPMPKVPPMPKEEKATPLPAPAPPVKNDTAESLNNPYLRVSQTREVPEVNAAQAKPGYSKAWSDALGLPADSQQNPQQYTRVR